MSMEPATAVAKSRADLVLEESFQSMKNEVSSARRMDDERAAAGNVEAAAPRSRQRPHPSLWGAKSASGFVAACGGP
jgi:hypothetical protein